MLNFFRKNKPKFSKRKKTITVMNDKSFSRELEKKLERAIGITPSRLTEDFESSAVRGSFSNAVRASAAQQRDYARTLLMNSPQIKKAAQYQIDNVVGADGINPQPRLTNSAGELDKIKNSLLNDSFKYWSSKRNNFSIDGKHNWRSFSLLIESARFIDGEVFIRIHEDNEFKVEIIGADRVPYGEIRETTNTFTRNGIEYDKNTKKPVSYSFKEINPITDTQTGQLIVVPADQVIHYYIEKVPGQQRGITELSAVIATTIQYDEFMKAAIVQKRQAASSMGFITQDKDSKQDINLGLDDDEEENEEQDIIQEIEAGTIQKLPAGTDIKQFSATQGADDADKFSDLLDGHISMGLNFYKQGYKGDTSGVNYSSARFGAMNEKGNFRNVQSTLQEVVLAPLYEKWVVFMIRTDRLDFKMVSIPTIIASTAWTFPRRESIDPVKDTENDIKLVDSGFKSASQVILERGEDPEKVFAEIESEKDRYVPKQAHQLAVAEAPAKEAENLD